MIRDTGIDIPVVVSSTQAILFGTIVALAVSGGKGLGRAGDKTTRKRRIGQRASEDKGDARATINAVAAATQTAGQGHLDLVGLQLGQMSQ